MPALISTKSRPWRRRRGARAAQRALGPCDPPVVVGSQRQAGVDANKHAKSAIVRAEPIAIGVRLPIPERRLPEHLAAAEYGVYASVPSADRWDIDASPNKTRPIGNAARVGGFLGRVDLFDAPFFGILRREAERMDPQQRLFLEVAIEALDHAGATRERLAGSATGVFIASYYNDYTLMQLADREWIDGRTLTGTQHSVLANRLSFLLDPRGPSISVDTRARRRGRGHLACRACARARATRLAGAFSLMLAPSDDHAVESGLMSASGRADLRRRRRWLHSRRRLRRRRAQAAERRDR